MDDDLQEQAQPWCRDCGVVMRDRPPGWVCPVCGWSISVDDVIVQPVFTGLALAGW
ncbi:hypothetical protein ACLQ2Q_20525 [Microbacterium sp. DT81.1]|uniref:hypothetical protein n=1 Tax=Microbacterium sp. DT81.1 TaxID=3393413 RepID=UPI003CE6E317